MDTAGHIKSKHVDSTASAALLTCICLKLALFERNKCYNNNDIITILKPKQVDCLLHLVCRPTGDVIGILPTGYGKSLIFELLPYLYRIYANACGQVARQCVIIVLSPLSSILKEQHCRYGNKALLMSADSNLENICEGYTYMLGHPEHILNKNNLDMFTKDSWQRKQVFIVVDEAHCVVKWGPDFRPAFNEIHKLKSVFPSGKILALTATATKKLTEELQKCLHMQEAKVIVITVDRPNIKLVVKQRLSSTGRKTVEQSFEAIFSPYIRDLKSKKETFAKTVIYSDLKWCGFGHELAVRKEVDGSDAEVSHLVKQYHKPCTTQMKESVAWSMKTGQTRLLFASEAYSMGTDVPDIRQIVHAGPPRCLETYLQEIGRAGRDGRQAVATLYYNATDISKAATAMTDAMREFCRTDECRRKFICSKFECEPVASADLVPHLCCDICESNCACEECAAKRNTSEASNDAVVGVTEVLLSYFMAENRSSDNGHTGLTENLAYKIAVDFLASQNTNRIEETYGIDSMFAKNISIILDGLDL